MGYVVQEEDSQTGGVTRRGPFVTEQEARMALGNLVEQAYDFNPQLSAREMIFKIRRWPGLVVPFDGVE